MTVGSHAIPWRFPLSFVGGGVRKRTRRRAVEAVEIARKWVRQCEMQGDSHRSHSATTADSLSGSAKDPMTATVTELLESQQP